MNKIVLACCLFAWSNSVRASEFQSTWPKQTERTWVGPEYWANRLQDWRIAEGRLECVGKAPMRTVHLLTRRLGKESGELQMSVRLGPIADGFAGFLIGAGPGLDYRAAALVHHSPGKGGGLIAGIDGKGSLLFRDNRTANPQADSPTKPLATSQDQVQLRLTAVPQAGRYTLTLSSHDPQTGRRLAQTTLQDVPANRLLGNLALCATPGKEALCWFRDWTVSGSKVEAHEDRRFGPVLCAQHTLSDGVLKLTAQMPPLGPTDTQTAQLQIRRGERWQTVDEQKMIVPGFTVTFRVPEWDSGNDTPYRIVYRLQRAGGRLEPCVYEGAVRRDPLDKASIVVAGFTGNHNTISGVERRQFPWTPNGIWFPHADLTARVTAHRPDVLFFTGDQVYEGASPTRPERGKNLMLDYLYKWYLWCWAFRDLAREIPCVCIPDDHDVYQGNLWGHGGRKTHRDHFGGYVHPAEFVKMVERTQTSHLPDPFDPTPVEQGIGVYYTGMNYGRISFAILEDRKFKSGCAGLVPKTAGRPDHVTAPGFDPKTADVPGAVLLGPRQLKFLEAWAADWRGVEMKVAVSQTVFAGLATHHGGGLQQCIVDYDANGWPQTGRNKALHELRRGFAFMLAGDQHLATLVHHGIDQFDDAGWSLAVPSIANFYPRAWRPEKPGMNREPGASEHTGQFFDGLGNRVTVRAVTNPGVKTGHEPAALHDRMPGYGIVRLNKKDRTLTVECWPRYADPTDPTAKQYPGWPRVIDQIDNYARRTAAYLPTLQFVGLTSPVVQVIDEADGQVVYTIRANGDRFRPMVFAPGTYTVRISEPGTPKMKEFEHIESLAPDKTETLEVPF